HPWCPAPRKGRGRIGKVRRGRFPIPGPGWRRSRIPLSREVVVPGSLNCSLTNGPAKLESDIDVAPKRGPGHEPRFRRLRSERIEPPGVGTRKQGCEHNGGGPGNGSVLGGERGCACINAGEWRDCAVGGGRPRPVVG